MTITTAPPPPFMPSAQRAGRDIKLHGMRTFQYIVIVRDLLIWSIWFRADGHYFTPPSHRLTDVCVYNKDQKCSMRLVIFLVRLAFFVLVSESEYFKEDQAFSSSYDLVSTPPPPCLPSANCFSFSVFLCVAAYSSERGEGAGGRAKSYDGEKSWSSINYQIHFGLQPFSLPVALPPPACDEGTACGAAPSTHPQAGQAPAPDSKNTFKGTGAWDS